jgi:hypothetical protein
VVDGRHRMHAHHHHHHDAKHGLKAARAASRWRVCDLDESTCSRRGCECSRLHALIGVARRRPRSSSSTGGTGTTDIAAESFLNEGCSRLGCPRERRSSHGDCCFCHSPRLTRETAKTKKEEKKLKKSCQELAKNYVNKSESLAYFFLAMAYLNQSISIPS